MPAANRDDGDGLALAAAPGEEHEGQGIGTLVLDKKRRANKNVVLLWRAGERHDGSFGFPYDGMKAIGVWVTRGNADDYEVIGRCCSAICLLGRVAWSWRCRWSGARRAASM